MDAIISFLINRWPIVLVVIVSIAVTIWLCKLYFGRFVPAEKKANDADTKLKDLDTVTTKISNLPCGKHEGMFEKIMEAITEIRTFLMIKNPKTAALFSHKHSPRKLNTEGENLFNEISGQKFIDDNIDYLVKEIEEKNPKTALDVENLALQVLYDNLDKDFFNNIKIWVYNCPTKKYIIDGEEKEYVITMDDVCFILSLPLRDRYLEIHPELQQ